MLYVSYTHVYIIMGSLISLSIHKSNRCSKKDISHVFTDYASGISLCKKTNSYYISDTLDNECQICNQK